MSTTARLLPACARPLLPASCERRRTIYVDHMGETSCSDNTHGRRWVTLTEYGTRGTDHKANEAYDGCWRARNATPAIDATAGSAWLSRHTIVTHTRKATDNATCAQI